MRSKKRILVMSTLLIAIVLLGIGTIAYFRRTVNGNITGTAGNLVLVVNEADAVKSETFEIVLKNKNEEDYVYPDDKGVFYLNIDSTGSSGDVEATITLSHTNLPENLKFYLDAEYTQEFTTKSFYIDKASTMTKTVPVYWYWNGSVNDEDDINFMDKVITANITVTATITQKEMSDLYTTLLNLNPPVDTDVVFGSYTNIASGKYNYYDHSLLMRDGTQNDKYPILYYRGDITNNNVIFADLCWLIVRTTETGGVKLVFNGPVVENADGTESCSNYSGVGGVAANASYTDVYVGNAYTKFNEKFDSPVYVGYMYNDTNTYFTHSASWTGASSIDRTGTLDADGYKAHLSDNSVIENGLDNETGRHTQNKTDSTIKEVIDDWYEENILGKPEESLLEDTIWCNDRSVISGTYSIQNYATNSNQFNFAANTRLDENATKTPSLACTRDMDKFTVDSANGNGDLDYPIGLLTADEINLAGHASSTVVATTYLRINISGSFWSLTPDTFMAGRSCAFYMYLGYLARKPIQEDAGTGARPSVSLGTKVKIDSGNGSFESPYIVS